MWRSSDDLFTSEPSPGHEVVSERRHASEGGRPCPGAASIATPVVCFSEDWFDWRNVWHGSTAVYHSPRQRTLAGMSAHWK
jgi:hypothetical protein